MTGCLAALRGWSYLDVNWPMSPQMDVIYVTIKYLSLLKRIQDKVRKVDPELEVIFWHSPRWTRRLSMHINTVNHWTTSIKNVVVNSEKWLQLLPYLLSLNYETAPQELQSELIALLCDCLEASKYPTDGTEDAGVIWLYLCVWANVQVWWTSPKHVTEPSVLLNTVPINQELRAEFIFITFWETIYVFFPSSTY